MHRHTCRTGQRGDGERREGDERRASRCVVWRGIELASNPAWVPAATAAAKLSVSFEKMVAHLVSLVSLHVGSALSTTCTTRTMHGPMSALNACKEGDGCTM